MRTIERIDQAALRSTAEFLLPAAEAASRPDQALVNLERWLKAAGNAATQIDSMLSVPQTGTLLVALLGASHQIADVLVQNPELASLVLDPGLLAERPNVGKLAAQIHAMLAGSTGYRHSLDRLRFLKQGWHLRIAAADLGGAWPEEDVWRALSDVADALIDGAAAVVWEEVCRQRGHRGPCPVTIVAMGKLGGQELNFSSDIDLVYLLDDDVDETEERLATKYCETLSRALSDRMGRGSLYRVDLRLRPYGSQGQLAPKFTSVEGYYARYAEPWEHLALIRSRVIVGDKRAEDRWEAMREATSFQTMRGEWVVQELLEVRKRIEESIEDADIKRGSGGIRDVEFLTQILQLLYAHSHPRLKCRQTREALRLLADEGLLDSAAASDLAASYVFLRLVEHRIQLLGDQQSHTVPDELEARSDLALRAGFSSVDSFDAALAMHRWNARNWYESILRPASYAGSAPRDVVLKNAGRLSIAVSRWIDSTEGASAFYLSLSENESSLPRVLAIAERAPALVPLLREDVTVTEQVMTGEILELMDPGGQHSVRGGDWNALAAALRRRWLKSAVRWALGASKDFGVEVAGVMDSAVAALLAATEAPFQAIALGSFGAREMALYSDLDVMLFSTDGLSLEENEKAAQKLLASVQGLRRAGAPIELDLRLRPEGRKGRLTVTSESLRAYEQGSMEPWERLALGRARALSGELPPSVKSAAFGAPLDAQTLASLKKMKRRVESERVPIQYRHRHIKLGPGGQDDVLWTVQTLWWRHSRAVDLGRTSVPDRLEALQALGALSAEEFNRLLESWRYLQSLRLHLGLLGFNDEVLPENPDKLARLGAVTGAGGPNEVLSEYERHAKVVRGLYESNWERLGG